MTLSRRKRRSSGRWRTFTSAFFALFSLSAARSLREWPGSKEREREARATKERRERKKKLNRFLSLMPFFFFFDLGLHPCLFASSSLPRPGDHIHLIHVIPRLQLAAVFGAPPVDFLPQQVRCFFFLLLLPFDRSVPVRPLKTTPPCLSFFSTRHLSTLKKTKKKRHHHHHNTTQDPAAYEQLIKNAEHFVSQRFLPRLLAIRPDPVVHLVKAEVDADSIGSVVCRKASDLNAAALVMASHTKSKLQEFFLGSVTNYCCHHCVCPVLVVK